MLLCDEDVKSALLERGAGFGNGDLSDRLLLVLLVDFSPDSIFLKITDSELCGCSSFAPKLLDCLGFATGVALLGPFTLLSFVSFVFTS